MKKGVIVERRAVPFQAELRAGAAPGVRLFDGYAAAFDQWADIGGMFRERVAPGAFARTIREQDVAFVFNHNESTVMARRQAGTLRLDEDSYGLHVEADLDERDDDARQLITKIEASNVYKMSFSFRAVRDEFDFDADPPERDLNEVQLYDVSPVVFPAYEGTDAKLRAEVRSMLTLRGLELPESAAERADRFAEAIEVITQVVPDQDRGPEQVRAAIAALEQLLEDEPPTEGGTADTGTPPVPPEHSLDVARARQRRRRRLIQAA